MSNKRTSAPTAIPALRQQYDSVTACEPAMWVLSQSGLLEQWTPEGERVLPKGYGWCRVSEVPEAAWPRGVRWAAGIHWNPDKRFAHTGLRLPFGAEQHWKDGMVHLVRAGRKFGIKVEPAGPVVFPGPSRHPVFVAYEPGPRTPRAPYNQGAWNWAKEIGVPGLTKSAHMHAIRISRRLERAGLVPPVRASPESPQYGHCQTGAHLDPAFWPPGADMTVTVKWTPHRRMRRLPPPPKNVAAAHWENGLGLTKQVLGSAGYRVRSPERPPYYFWDHSVTLIAFRYAASKEACP